MVVMGALQGEAGRGCTLARKLGKVGHCDGTVRVGLRAQRTGQCASQDPAGEFWALWSTRSRQWVTQYVFSALWALLLPVPLLGLSHPR